LQGGLVGSAVVVHRTPQLFTLTLNLVAAPVKARLILSLPTRLDIKPSLHSGRYAVHG